MKRKAAIAVALALLVAAAAGLYFSKYGGGGEWRPGKPLPRDRVKVGVIHVDDATAGYSYAHDRGIETMRRDLGLDKSQIIRKFNVNDADDIMVEHMMRACIDEGANIIVATSWGHGDTCVKLADLYPGVVFAHATGHRWNKTNFTNYFGRIYQARYLSGIAAGMKTVTGKIGFVAAMGKGNSEVTGGIDAFAIGVESVNPEAKVHVRVTNSWYDPAGERQATKRLIDSGCDVIAQHCNTPDPQRTAEEMGVWGIGYNSDMSADAPGAVLTSVLWNWGTYYTHLVKSVMDGSFVTTPYLGGLKEGMVGLAPLTPELTDAPMRQAVDAERKRIEEGTFNVFDGELRTNDDRIIGRSGGTLSDEEIVEKIDWYYHTVVEL